MKDEFKEANLNLKPKPFCNNVNTRKKKKRSKQYHLKYKMNAHLMTKLHGVVVEETELDFYLSRTLRFKLVDMLEEIKCQNSDLNKLYEDALLTENEKKANEFNDKIIELYKSIISWAKTNNSWWLEDPHRLISIGVVNNFMKYYNKSRGDRPLSLSREKHEEETKRTKNKKNVGSVFEKKGDND